MSQNFIKSDKADSFEQFDNDFSQTSTYNDTENKGNRILSFIENVDQEGGKLNMSGWNIILLGTAVVGFASIVITVTCLVCFCCILNKRKNRQKNQTQYCSPDIIMNVAGNFQNLFLQLIIHKLYVFCLGVKICISPCEAI